tara:strand:+ start:4927 stop:5211 length:285 start_codon:yes stop_codon:yes gene_type:complete
MSYLETGSVIEAIMALNPDADVSVIDNDPDRITWNKGDVIAKDVILAKVIAMQYIEKRKKEYPEIKQQLDDIYHNGIDEWKKTIKAVKDKYPKG